MTDLQTIPAETPVRLFKEEEIDCSNIELISELISQCEKTNGKLPEILRLYDHFLIIFEMISTRKNRLGTKIYNLFLKSEISQLQTIFNYNTSNLIQIITSKDYKQYKTFCILIRKRRANIIILDGKLNKIIRSLKLDYIRNVERTLVSSLLDKINNSYIDQLRDINKVINNIKSYNHDLNFILEPNTRSPDSTKCSHKDHLCAAKPVFGLSQEEYKDLITDEDDKIIIIHKSRRYNCSVSLNSFDMFIKKCMQGKIYPKIVTPKLVELYAICPCAKINDIPCTKRINIDDILRKNNKYDENKLQLIEKKKDLIKKYYGIDIYIRCPKPDCPNGDGFTIETLLKDILEGKNSSEISPLHKCTLCDTIWCSKCDKIHPGRICPEPDDEELDPNIKRCPKCKTLTSRDGGCFHINCSKCNVHWCWECNHFTNQSDAYSHTCITGNWLPTNTNE